MGGKGRGERRSQAALVGDGGRGEGRGGEGEGCAHKARDEARAARLDRAPEEDLARDAEGGDEEEVVEVVRSRQVEATNHVIEMHRVLCVCVREREREEDERGRECEKKESR